MAKDTYYFSHDYDPIGDPKMQAMVGDFGGLGYGIFWRIVEMLHADSSHRLPLKKYIYNAISVQMKTTPEYVEELITKCADVYELFTEQDGFIVSNRVIRNIESKDEKKKKKSDAGRIGGIKSGKSRKSKQNEAKNNLLQSGEAMLEANEPNEAKERKGKESKGNDNGALSAMTEKEFVEFSQKMKADKLFTQPLFTAGVKPEYLDNWIIHFHIQIVGDDKINKDYNEYRKHFKNWLKKQDYCNPPPTLSALDKIKQFNQPTAPPLTYLK